MTLYHGAFDATKTCRTGRASGSPSIVPKVMTVNSGPLRRRMNNCDPHFEQKHLRRFADDSYSEMKAAPAVTVRAAVGTTEFVEKAAPCALRHMEQ